MTNKQDSKQEQKPLFDQLINDIKDNDWYCVQNGSESEMEEWEKAAIIAGLMELKRSEL